MSSKSHQITINNTQTLTHASNDTLLETLEKQGIEIQYHCREGFCGACRTTLNAGQVEYTIAPLAFIDDDEILPCCCKPTSDIAINID